MPTTDGFEVRWVSPYGWSVQFMLLTTKGRVLIDQQPAGLFPDQSRPERSLIDALDLALKMADRLGVDIESGGRAQRLQVFADNNGDRLAALPPDWRVQLSRASHKLHLGYPYTLCSACNSPDLKLAIPRGTARDGLVCNACGEHNQPTGEELR